MPVSVPNPPPRQRVESDQLWLDVERLEHKLHRKLLCKSISPRPESEAPDTP